MLLFVLVLISSVKDLVVLFDCKLPAVSGMLARGSKSVKLTLFYGNLDDCNCCMIYDYHHYDTNTMFPTKSEQIHKLSEIGF